MYSFDLNTLPRTATGLISWKQLLNQTLSFTKDGKNYQFTIIKYNAHYLTVNFQGVEIPLPKDDLKSSNFDVLFKRKYGYRIGDTIQLKTGEIKIIDIVHKPYKSGTIPYYTATCSSCGGTKEFKSGRINSNNVCSICTNKMTVYGINSLKDIYPEIANMLLDKELAKITNAHSNNYLDFICPDCGSILNKQLRYVVRNGLFCNACGHGYKGIRYPQLLVTNIIRNLPIEVKIEQTFDWSLNKKTKHFKRFDIFLPAENMIIETNGLHHYKDKVFGGITLEEIIKNDILKRILAFKNGIDKFSYIDTSCSSFNFVKENVCANKMIQELFIKYGIDLYDEELWSDADKATTSQIILQQNIFDLAYDNVNINSNHSFKLTSNQVEALNYLKFVRDELNNNANVFFNSEHPKNSQLWNYLFNFDNNPNTINEILQSNALPIIHYIEHLDPIKIPYDVDVYEFGCDYDVCFDKCELALDRIVWAIECYLSAIE